MYIFMCMCIFMHIYAHLCVYVNCELLVSIHNTDSSLEKIIYMNKAVLPILKPKVFLGDGYL